MKYEQKPNTATVFENEDKRPDQVMKNPDGTEWVRKDADFKGSGIFNGMACWVDMHRKTSKAGKEYYSIKVKPKGQPAPAKKAVNSGLTEENWATFKDDEINF
jgi:hypothetical protein